MPRGGYRNSRKRPVSNKSQNRTKRKWVEPKDESFNESENVEEEAVELSQYDQLLQTFKDKKPKLEESAVNDEHDDDDDDSSDADDTKDVNKKLKSFVSPKNSEINEKTNESSDGAIETVKSKKKNEKNGDGGEKDEDKVVIKDEENVDVDADKVVLKADESDEEEDTPDDDPLLEHFSGALEDTVAEDFLVKATWNIQPLQNKWKEGMMYYQSPVSKPLHELTLFSHHDSSLKSVTNVYRNLAMCNKKFLTSKAAELADPLTPFQDGLFSILDHYMDVHLAGAGGTDEEVKVTYCTHVLRHLLKSTKLVLKHNTKLKNKTIEEARDQGLTRAKALIVVPMRSHAYKIISILISLLYTDKLHVSNRARLMTDFCVDDTGFKKGLKPDDYEATFDGNTDDNFKLGVVVRKRSLKLFTDFYDSDLVIASPLALKHVIRPNNTTTGHWDFLSSIEVLVMDCMEVLLMQNWANVMLLLTHVNKRLVKSHNTDLSRTRLAYLNGWGSLYRQNILVSSFQTAEFASVFNKHCSNIKGKVLVQTAVQQGSICNVVSTLPQTFRRFEVAKVSEATTARFNFFVKNVLPDFLNNPTSNIVIFIPSYYDFVRIKNHFKNEDLSFAVISDHTEEKDVEKARQQFFLSNVKFLLFTERFHFYHRYQIKGIKHVIFYELPHNGPFYGEFCNMMGLLASKHSSHHSCLALYCKYDLHRLAGVLGSSRAERLVLSDRPSHLFMSSDA